MTFWRGTAVVFGFLMLLAGVGNRDWFMIIGAVAWLGFLRGGRFRPGGAGRHRADE